LFARCFTSSFLRVRFSFRPHRVHTPIPLWSHAFNLVDFKNSSGFFINQPNQTLSVGFSRIVCAFSFTLLLPFLFVISFWHHRLLCFLVLYNSNRIEFGHCVAKRLLPTLIYLFLLSPSFCFCYTLPIRLLIVIFRPPIHHRPFLCNSILFLLLVSLLFSPRMYRLFLLRFS
jgi:hypothetical protein